MEYKKQHFVPQSYLSAWVDPNKPDHHSPYVWLFDIRSMKFSRRSPKNIFYETDLYTITDPDGERDLRLEKALSQLEGKFAALVRDKITQKLLLSAEDKVIVSAFISAMHSRTPSRSDEMLPFWKEALEKMEMMAEWAKTADHEEIERMSKFSEFIIRKNVCFNAGTTAL